jgi:hypothetical protein
MISPLNRTKETYKKSQFKSNYIEYNSLCRDKIKPGVLSCLMDGEQLKESKIEFELHMNLLRKYLEYKGMLYNNILIITHHSVINYLTGYNLNNGESVTVDNLYQL